MTSLCPVSFILRFSQCLLPLFVVDLELSWLWNHMSSLLEEWDLRSLFVASLLIRASLRWSVPLALNESKRGTFCVFLPSFPGAANEKEVNYLCKMAALLQQWQAFSALKQQYSKLKEEERGGSEKRWSTQNVTPQPAMRLVHLMAFTSNPV